MTFASRGGGKLVKDTARPQLGEFSPSHITASFSLREGVTRGRKTWRRTISRHEPSSCQAARRCRSKLAPAARTATNCDSRVSSQLIRFSTVSKSCYYRKCSTSCVVLVYTAFTIRSCECCSWIVKSNLKRSGASDNRCDIDSCFAWQQG